MSRVRAGVLVIVIVVLAALLGWWTAGALIAVPDPAAEARPRASDVTPARKPAPATGFTISEELLAPRDDPEAEQARRDHLSELADAMAQLGGSILCHLDPPLEAELGSWQPAELPAESDDLPALVIEGRVVLAAVSPAGEGVLQIPRYEPVRITWHGAKAGAPGICSPDPVVLREAEPAAIVGVVRNAEGEPEGKVWVDGCGGKTLTDVDGGYYLEAVPGPCELRAYRIDGMFTARSGPVAVTPVSGEERIVDIHLPPFRTGGFGMQIQEEDEGIVILRTYEGGSAYESGLRHGDLVLSVNGQPTVDLTVQEFVDVALGEPGTEVELVVRQGGEERTLTLERREMAR